MDRKKHLFNLTLAFNCYLKGQAVNWPGRCESSEWQQIRQRNTAHSFLIIPLSDLVWFLWVCFMPAFFSSDLWLSLERCVVDQSSVNDKKVLRKKIKSPPVREVCKCQAAIFSRMFLLIGIQDFLESKACVSGAFTKGTLGHVYTETLLPMT
jgi:hypothetical protein